MDKYAIIEPIENGSFGFIYLAHIVNTTTQVAIKRIPKDCTQLNSVSSHLCGSTHLNSEHIILQELKHPNIVKLLDVVENRGDLSLIMEYAPNGDLHTLITKKKKLTDEEAKPIIYQMTKALQYIHKSGYIHCDIKPENVLLFNEGIVKLADFGLAAKWKPGTTIKISRGSPHYASPEALFNLATEGPNIDVWSLGIVIYVVIVGGLPFSDINHLKVMHQQIRETGVYIPTSVPFEIANLLKQMLESNVSKRISIQGVLDHPWLTKKRGYGCMIF